MVIELIRDWSIVVLVIYGEDSGRCNLLKIYFWFKLYLFILERELIID